MRGFCIKIAMIEIYSGEDYSVKRNRRWCVVAVALLLLAISGCALAESAISTTVVMRVSRMTQNAVVNAGEDLSMEVNIEGVTPESYQWYFEDQPIGGANQKAYSIVNAQTEDSGVYRLDAFDADGRMLVSMDINARVVDDVLPQSGDASLPVHVAVLALALASAALAVVFWTRRRA